MPVIKCHTLPHTTWNNIEKDSRTLNSAVHIFRVQQSVNTALIDDYRRLLSAEEKDRAVTYHKEHDRKRFIICRGVLRILLAVYTNCEPAAIPIGLGKNKKPFVNIDGTSCINFNVTHSGDWILIALSDLPVGVDVEYIDNNFAYTDILPACFNKAETSIVENSTSPHNAFYLLWTRKEALVKATGSGIDNNMECVPCLDGAHELLLPESITDWQVGSFEIANGYIASVAHDASLQNISFYETKGFPQ